MFCRIRLPLLFHLVDIYYPFIGLVISSITWKDPNILILAWYTPSMAAAVAMSAIWLFLVVTELVIEQLFIGSGTDEPINW